MFLKVFKYDLGAMGKALIPAPGVWLLSLAAALLVRLMNLDFMMDLVFPEMVAGIAVFFCLAGVVCYPFAVVFMCLRRYYNHFFSDEGYLTFTLPVRRETHLLSKTLASFVVTLAAGVAEIMAGLVFLALLPERNLVVQEMNEGITELVRTPGSIPLVILYLLVMLFSLVEVLATMHVSITLGQALAKKLKIFAAFGIWYGASIVKRTLTQGIGLFFVYALLAYEENGIATSFFGVQGPMYVYVGLLFVLEAGWFCLAYFLNRKLLKTRLSLA